jgi:hypothetical protein
VEQQHASIQNEGHAVIRKRRWKLFDQIWESAQCNGSLHDSSLLLDASFGASTPLSSFGDFTGLKLLHGFVQSHEELIEVPLLVLQAFQLEFLMLPFDPSTNEILDEPKGCVKILEGFVSPEEAVILLDKVHHQ